jgi:carboxypeptidase C (cathepsin A)
MRLFVLLALLCLSNAQFQQVVGLPNSQAITDVSYSGFVQVDPAKQDAKLFGWFFPSRSNPKVDPVVLWMTGGPGCSSELAILFENGPFSVDTNLNLVPNPYSWTNNASVIFIDQPFGTGFSPKPQGDVVYNEEIMAQYVYNFLQGFFLSTFLIISLSRSLLLEKVMQDITFQLFPITLFKKMLLVKILS